MAAIAIPFVTGTTLGPIGWVGIAVTFILILAKSKDKNKGTRRRRRKGKMTWRGYTVKDAARDTGVPLGEARRAWRDARKDARRDRDFS